MNDTANGFWDVFGRLTDTAVSVINATKSNQASQQAEQQTALQEQSSQKTLKIALVVFGVAVVVFGGFLLLKKG